MAFGKKDKVEEPAQEANTQLEATSNHLPADMSLAEQIKADLAAVANQVEGSSVERIRLSSKGFTTPDGDTGETLTCVIVDFATANNYYAQPFDRDNPTPPDCWAVSKIPSDLKPDASVSAPQSDTCASCPMNKFESGVGKSKACKNTRLLAIMQLDAADDSPIWLLSVPPSSIRNFDTYVTTTLKGRHNVTPAMVVTQIYMDPNKTFPAPRCKFERLLDDEELKFYYGRRPEAEAVLLQKR